MKLVANAARAAGLAVLAVMALAPPTHAVPMLVTPPVPFGGGADFALCSAMSLGKNTVTVTVDILEVVPAFTVVVATSGPVAVSPFKEAQTFTTNVIGADYVCRVTGLSKTTGTATLSLFHRGSVVQAVSAP